MAPETGLAVGSRQTVEPPRPELSGWAGVATAIHAIQQMPTPMTLKLDVAGHGLVSIDFPFHAFEWGTPITEFPEHPASVMVETRPASHDQPSIALPGRPLDSLLWLIGYHAFGDQPAPWLREGDRYRLRRWPTLAELSIDLDQVRMTAMLGNAYATADELAAAAHTPPADARRLVNAFSVTGILRRSSGAPALEQIATARGADASRSGLFSRLRDRFGH
jgi:hypothetical protein